MKLNKNWLLSIPSALISIYIWSIYAFAKVECICLWNKFGFIIATISAIITLSIQIISISILIKHQSKKIYAYHVLWAIISIVFYFAAIRIFLALLT